MGTSGLDRYAYVGNSPMNYVDPSGHICVNNQGTDNEVAMSGDCGGGEDTNWNGQVTPSPSGWTGSADDEVQGGGLSVPTAGNGLVGPTAPQGYYISNPPATLLNYENDYSYLYSKYPDPNGIITMNFLHRSNTSVVVPVYQNNIIVGYHYVDVSIDLSTIRVDLSVFTPGELLSRGFDYAIGQNIEHLAGISGDAALETLAKRASWISNAYDVVKTINDVVVFDGYLTWSPFIPYTPQNMTFPSFHETFLMPSPIP